MNRYSQQATPATSMPMVTGLFAALIATQALPYAEPMMADIVGGPASAYLNRYHSTAPTATLAAPFGYMGQMHTSNVEFESAITGFFTKLSANQILLDDEFARVLANNLWDLYVE